MTSDDYDLIFKIILIGDSGVGKTNLLSQYIKQKFYKDSKATVGVEFGSKILEIEKTRIKAQIWDTAGQERYRSITSTYYKGSKGALVVYDVTRPGTFENVDRWISDLRNAADRKISVILVGNKIDLKENIAVTTQEGENKAKELGIGFIETSALDYNSVDKAFDLMIRNIFQQYKERKKAAHNNDLDGEKDEWDLDKGSDLKVMDMSNENDDQKCNC